jgi:hypothetical protein
VVVGQFDKSEVRASETITEPSADRGPQQGCPAVDAPDAKLNSEDSVNPSNYHHPT